MKTLILSACILISSTAFAQVEITDGSIAKPGKMKKDFFITTNSGVLNTPVGLKIGFVSSPGLYLGFRHGIGEVYHSDSDLTTTNTNLISITMGTNFPLIVKNDFKLIGQAGAGYGEWWDYRWERWTNSGAEFEAGLMLQKKNFLFNISGNVLVGSKTYATGDLCVGVGFIMNRCQ
jgi:hypothetical protein